MISLDKIPDALGHLILAEDGVILSVSISKNMEINFRLITEIFLKLMKD